MKWFICFKQYFINKSSYTQDKDIYGTGSDRKLKAYINHLLVLVMYLLSHAAGGGYNILQMVYLISINYN